MRSFKLLVCGVGLVALTACNSVRMTSVWKDAEFTGPLMRHVMVMGVGGEETQRRNFEDSFADHLSREGVAATKSYRVFPEDVKLDRKTIHPELQRQDVDGVLVSYVVSTDTKEIYSPPQMMVVPRHYRVGLYGHYAVVWDHVHSPGYYTQVKELVLETQLYDARSGKLVWSGQSESYAPSSSEKLIDEYSALLVKALREVGLLTFRPQ